MIALLPLCLLVQALRVRADDREDEARLGSFYTTIPLWRSGSGTNVVNVGIGNPPQDVNLTLSKCCMFLIGSSR